MLHKEIVAIVTGASSEVATPFIANFQKQIATVILTSRGESQIFEEKENVYQVKVNLVNPFEVTSILGTCLQSKITQETQRILLLHLA